MLDLIIEYIDTEIALAYDPSDRARDIIADILSYIKSLGPNGIDLLDDISDSLYYEYGFSYIN